MSQPKQIELGRMRFGVRNIGFNVRRTALFLSISLLIVGAVWLGPLFAASNSVLAAPSAQNGAGILAIVGEADANLYDAPGGNPIRTWPIGSVLTAVGRSGDSVWLVVQSDDGQAGWMEAADLVAFGIDGLPVMLEGAVDGGMVENAPADGAASGGTPVGLPSPTATPTQPPTATPTPSPTPTPTATPTPSPVPVSRQTFQSRGTIVAVVGGRGASVYDSPDGSEVSTLPVGTALTLSGRSADGQWLYFEQAAGDSGWLEADQIVVFNQESLPVTSGGDTVPAEAGDMSDEASAPAGVTEETQDEMPPADASQAAAPSSVAQRSIPTAGENDITAEIALTDSRLNVRVGPGTEYAIAAKALPGELYPAIGRNGTATWVQIAISDTEEGFGWVSADFITLSEPVVNLPISTRTASPPAATPAPVTAKSMPASAPGAGMLASQLPPARPTGLTGNLVFQATNGGAIYVYNLDNGGLRKLTGGFDPAVSPDGKTVAFTRDGGENGIYLIGIDGSDERKIFGDRQGLRSPSWSPDGNWIVFSRDAKGYKCRDVGFGICLIDNPFLERFDLVTKPEWQLSRVDTNGDNFRDLATLNTSRAPNWNEGGIVYDSSTGLEITEDTPDGDTRLLLSSRFAKDPNWQPDGDRIVYQSEEGSHWEVFIMNADGAGEFPLTRPATTLVDELPHNVAPAWSPDGAHIVFLSSRDEKNDHGAWRLWVMNADGSNQRPLPVGVAMDYSFGGEQVVSWGVPVN